MGPTASLKSRPRLARAVDKVVISFGGSVVAPAEPDPEYLRAVVERIQAWAKDLQVLVVVGGGQPARKYIRLARSLQVGEEDLDRIGVMATRLNAQLVQSMLHAWGAPVARELPVTTQHALGLSRPGQVVVMGGTTPGHSTDFVAAELAVGVGAARLVNVTNVDGVYTKDPAQHPDAQHKPRLDFDELLQIIEEEEWTTAGAPGVLDGPATVLIATNGVRTCVVSGKDLDNVECAVRGQAFQGTLVEGRPVALKGAKA